MQAYKYKTSVISIALDTHLTRPNPSHRQPDEGEICEYYNMIHKWQLSNQNTRLVKVKLQPEINGFIKAT